jgi:hypothetical protein
MGVSMPNSELTSKLIELVPVLRQLHSAHGDDTKEVFTKKLIRKEIGF